jgi:hypothetical protein
VTDEVENVVAASGGWGDSFDPGWVASDHYRLLSLAVTVRSTEPEWAEALAWHLEPFRIRDQGEQALEFWLYRREEDEGGYRYEGSEIRDWEELSPALLHALWDVHGIVPRATRDFLDLHSGALARNGHGLLLPASQDVGKSTTSVALMAAGFDYLSDEVGAIDPVTGKLYPFPKKVQLDPEAMAFFPDLADRLDDRRGLTGRLLARFVSPADMGARVAEPARPRWIVFLEPDRTGPPRLEAVSRAAAVERMAENSSNLYRYGDRGVVLLSRVAQGAEAFSLSGGNPKERAELLAERLAP